MNTLKDSISIFAFKGGHKSNISTRVAKNLNFLNVTYLDFPDNSHQRTIDSYLTKVQEEKPLFILGLGQYGGRDKTPVRIETLCKNKFRNDKIFSHGPDEYKIKPFIKENEIFKKASGLGNSWCNQISYRIMRLKEEGNLRNTKYTFLHIREDVDAKEIAKRISPMLKLKSLA